MISSTGQAYENSTVSGLVFVAVRVGAVAPAVVVRDDEAAPHVRVRGVRPTRRRHAGDRGPFGRDQSGEKEPRGLSRPAALRPALSCGSGDVRRARRLRPALCRAARAGHRRERDAARLELKEEEGGQA